MPQTIKKTMTTIQGKKGREKRRSFRMKRVKNAPLLRKRMRLCFEVKGKIFEECILALSDLKNLQEPKRVRP